ncbi:MAG: hypothetical protein SAJ37_15870 [Oscillatoria sp. PMC 1068.18]|nr:hypothetical protein [Oscillatoria sp. PMC 1076.18]MEC4990210.1 hypothetical protein [Oscillatoria sp. PMC 1068.18]
MQKKSSIKINFTDLATIKNGNSQRLLLSDLDMNSHIHGELIIKIKDRCVPRLGYWGKNDVCFSQWIQKLTNIRQNFRGKINSVYVFDEGEQGQPAFLFERKGEMMYLSIVDSRLSDGKGEKNWQKVEFSYRDFVREYEGFCQQFFAEIEKAASQTAPLWVKKFLPKLASLLTSTN